MIWESWPWKCYLAGHVAGLRKRKRQRRWSAASLARMERDVLLSAYSVRKLIEAQKLSDEVEASSLNAQQHEPLGRPVDIMNWHKLDQLFDLSTSTETTLGLRKFCDQIIHSFVLVPLTGPALEGFFVASDWEKGKRLLFFDIDTVIDVLDRVANDDIIAFRALRNSADGPMVVVEKKAGRRRTGGHPEQAPKPSKDGSAPEGKR